MRFRPWLFTIAAPLAQLAADTLQPLGDEFGNAASILQWKNLQVEEQWGANQLEAWDINNTTPGQMRLMPYTSEWFNHLRGALVFKELTGDFVCTARVRIRSRHNPANPDEVPNRQYTLAGIFAHAPRGPGYRGAPNPYTNSEYPLQSGTPVWPYPGSGSNWQPFTENYIFLSFGAASPASIRKYEVKSTRNGTSQLYYNNLGVPGTANNNEIELQMIRVGGTVAVLRRHPASGGGWDNWIVENRYPNPSHQLPVWGTTLQVGITTYTDWDSVQGSYWLGNGTQQDQLRQWLHNYTQLAGTNPYSGQPFRPDLIADIEYVRYQRPDAAVTESGLQSLVTTFSTGTLQYLPSTGVGGYLGDNANTPLGAVAFDAVNYTVNEIAGNAIITVTRSGSSTDRPLSLQYATSNGTATAGADYTNTSGILSWGSNDTAAKTITVPLNSNDGLAEGDETLSITLSQLDGPATFAASVPTLVATVTVQDAPRDAWRLAQFGANANGAGGQLTADLDLDGLRNLLEYALGSSPNIASTAPLPVAGTGGGHLSLSFTRNTAATDVSLIVEASGDLAAWSAIATRAAGAASWTNLGAFSADENGSGVVTVVDGAPLSPGIKRFLRLRADAP